MPLDQQAGAAAATGSRHRVLAVDDASDDLVLLEDALAFAGLTDEVLGKPLIGGRYRNRVELRTVTSPAEAIEILKRDGPFAVVVSDMAMPEMNGTALLRAASELAPETVRVLMTGLHDQAVAVDAVNEGHVFRFISKPASPSQLGAAIEAALDQHLLLTTQRDLLTQTVQGAVRLISDILSMTNPQAFGRTVRIRQLVRDLSKRLDAARPWEIELAAMLGQLGLIAVPAATVQKLASGSPLTRAEIDQYRLYPKIGADLVSHIPRLENIAEIIRYQEEPISNLAHGEARAPIPPGSRILKVALDYDALLGCGSSPTEASHLLSERGELYEPKVVEALQQLLADQIVYAEVRVSLSQLQAGATLAEDLLADDGSPLLAAGQVVTAPLLARARNMIRESRHERTVRVLEPRTETLGRPA